MGLYLQKSQEESTRLILSIPHKSCAKAMQRNWKVRADNEVRAQSVLWLFCWAKTGMGSEQARQAAILVFDQILPLKFRDVDRAVNHEHARKARYVAGDTELQLGRILDSLTR